MIIDSRGNPTVEVDVHLENGTIGRGIAPSGASTGDKEALELRDKGSKWCGKGVETAIGNVNQYIKPALLGMGSLEIEAIDLKMINLDGTDNKTHLGANATLAVSLAVVQAGAHANGFVNISESFNKIGSTVDVLEKRKDLTPSIYADFVEKWVAAGATLVGGCCEVGPMHIKELSSRLRS